MGTMEAQCKRSPSLLPDASHLYKIPPFLSLFLCAPTRPFSFSTGCCAATTQPLHHTRQYAVLVISQDNAGSVCMSKASSTRDGVQKAAYDSKIKALEDQVSYFFLSFHSRGGLDHSKYRRERAVSIDKGNGYAPSSELLRRMSSFFWHLVSLKDSRD